jgi:hypothetical protein
MTWLCEEVGVLRYEARGMCDHQILAKGVSVKKPRKV